MKALNVIKQNDQLQKYVFLGNFVLLDGSVK